MNKERERREEEEDGCWRGALIWEEWNGETRSLDDDPTSQMQLLPVARHCRCCRQCSLLQLRLMLMLMLMVDTGVPW